MLLHHRFERCAHRVPDKTALVFGARRLSYSELAREVRALTHALRADGLQSGDRVLIMLGQSPEYAVALHAVLAAGGVAVPVSPHAKGIRLAFLAKDTRASMLLSDARLAPAWTPLLAGESAMRACRIVGQMDSSLPTVRPWPGPDAPAPECTTDRIDQDLAMLIYTSGTTGTPKGVMLSHANMVSAWNSVQSYLGLLESDVIGLALPVAYSYGLYNLLMGLGTGATVVLEPHAAFPLRMLQTMVRERVTVLPGVPTLFAGLLNVPELQRFDLRALRILTNAAAALPDPHCKRLVQAWPHARLYSMYGLTECKRVSYLPPELLAERPGSVGRGIPNQDHWLIDEKGRRLPFGSTGELVVRGSHVMRGYWSRPQETAERLRPGPLGGDVVLHTGDLFRTDAEGFLYFVSRKDDIIKTRGEKVAPREVENVIHLLDGVTGCAVVGVPDSVLGEKVKAFVTIRPGTALAERDIIRHCLTHLESHMAPQAVELVDTLPLTESGKIRHASLRVDQPTPNPMVHP